ncbi:hypothetical protein QYE76_039136 [Lolium multiflorum]|uniref:CCHC-type domain-containing protein n=1 Tax=Lolium multiflorum TaxID=4521 RepID=A0AAD8WU68_LOLMU|nr:hypothetical protein QYE76_039136 [Lolium multiflorum]
MSPDMERYLGMGFSSPKDPQNLSLEEEKNSCLDALASHVFSIVVSNVVTSSIMPFGSSHELWTKLQDKYDVSNIIEDDCIASTSGRDEFSSSSTSPKCVKTQELKAQVFSLKNDLVKGHEGKCKLDKMLSVQQSPNDKSGLGFNSNNKNKSKKNNKKKGQVQVKDPTKIVCFKCKIEGHHIRSCPLKKKQKGNGLKLKLIFNLKLKKCHFPRRIKPMLPLWRNLVRRRRRKELATYAVRRATSPPFALLVPHPTLSPLMMFILFVRMRVAMCLPNLLVLKVVSRKEPFGLPSLL